MSERPAHIPLAVLGAGSWGTALAIQFARSGRPVKLWGRDRAQLSAMTASGRNERYLPSAPFPPSLVVEPDLSAALAGARDVLVVVPSPALRELLVGLEPLGRPGDVHGRREQRGERGEERTQCVARYDDEDVAGARERCR